MSTPAANVAEAIATELATNSTLANAIADALIDRIATEPHVADALAGRIAQRLTASPNVAELVTAAELATRFGVTRAYVYDNATELGAIRLGDGPRARLRFDPAIAHARLADLQPAVASAADGHGGDQASRTQRRKRPQASPKPGSVLTVRGTRPGGHDR